ncbi:MAG TPA: transglutaminase-like cysteine peptidase [Gemmataceae bacterium]|nr:transglutaminase-like cysteine peptidase [Gemmataceae bacterium]
MYRRLFIALISIAFAAVDFGTGAYGFGLGYTHQLKWSLERIEFDTPTLAPFAHVQFCLRYPHECRVQHVVFHGGKVRMTERRWAQLEAINARVNRSISPEDDLRALRKGWTIAPREGNCADYAVTKRHELLALGWPERALLLSEVVTPWGEHHLVVVVRTREGDFVIDNLSPEIRPWFRTPYQWVRIQSPSNPNFWSTLKETAA